MTAFPQPCLRLLTFVLLCLSSPNLVAGTAETADNDQYITATPLPSSEIAAPQRMFLAVADGRIEPVGDVDFWRFEALAGDVLTVALDVTAGELFPRLELQNGAGGVLASNNSAGPHGNALIRYTVLSSGLYYAVARPYNTNTTYVGSYQITVQINRGLATENDPNFRNNNINSAETLAFIANGSSKIASMAGRITGPENTTLDIDHFRLGLLNAGNRVELATEIPTGSSLVALAGVIDQDGFQVADEDGNPSDGHFLATIPADGTYYAQLVAKPFWVREGQRYEFTPSLNWTQAEAAAVNLGGHLATINDEEENNWVRFSLYPSSIWIGLNDLDRDGIYSWSDGSPLDYTNWQTNSPRAGYDAVGFSIGIWFSQQSTQTLRGLIQRPDPDGLVNAGSGPQASYILHVTVTDTEAPTIVAISELPDEGESMLYGLEQFALSFNEALNPETVLDAPKTAVYEGRSYLLSSTAMNWADARAWAQSLDSDLLTIENQAQQDWIFAEFGGINLWLGLNDVTNEGTHVWVDGTLPGYTNWYPGEPNTSSYDGVVMNSNWGTWVDASVNSTYRVLILLPETFSDGDGDGLPDAADPYPQNANNGFDLRSAGYDDVFDSADDIVYSLKVTPVYTTGLTLTLRIEDGPLDVGHYRFSASSELRDPSGNSLDGDGDGTGGDAFSRVFWVDLPDGVVPEGRSNQTQGQAVPLALTEAPADSGFFQSEVGFGRSRDNSDIDWWSFEAQAGDLLAAWVNPYESESMSPTLYLYDESGNYVTSTSGGSGPANGIYLSGLPLASDGTYYLYVSQASTQKAHYQVRLQLARGLAMETDANYANNTLPGADALTLETQGSLRTKTVAGTIMGPEYDTFDQDRYNLGLINAGNTLELNLRLPSNSSLDPVAAILDQNGEPLADEDGNPNDDHFLATITSTGVYYAQVSSEPYWTYNGHRYQWIASHTWAEAEAEAQLFGGHLITINDADEQAWVRHTFGAMSVFWLGLNALENPGTFVWADGSGSSYRNWAPGEPNTAGYRATVFSSNFWTDYPATNSRPGFAEFADPYNSSGLGAGPDAHYLLDVVLADTVPPRVTAIIGLPEQGGETLAGVDAFQVTVSEALDPSSVGISPRFYTFNGHSYLVAPTSMNWAAAQAYATNLGGGLVSINSAEEQAWLLAHFGTSNFWIGLNDVDTEGQFEWEDGSPVNYTNWYPGEPNTPSYDTVYTAADTGQWYDAAASASYMVIVEMEPSAILDTDGDGLPDSVDAYPTDAYNGWDLRTAGADGTFDTADDATYLTIVSPAYSTGLTLNLRVLDGPLEPGSFRLRISPSLRDLVGNNLDGNGDGISGDAYEHYFSITTPANTVWEGRNNHSRHQAVMLALTEDPLDSGFFNSEVGSGGFSTPSDYDWWAFEGRAGDRLAAWLYMAGGGGSSYLYLYNAAGTNITSDGNSGPGSDAYISGFVLPTDGIYYLAAYRSSATVSYYQIQLQLSRGMLMETDANYSNDTLSGADSLPLVTTGTSKSQTITGTIMALNSEGSDEDLFAMGLLNSGNRVSLSLRLPTYSSLTPQLSLLNSAGQTLVDEDGNPNDNHFEATIQTDGLYYAQVTSNWIRDGKLYQLLPSQSWTSAEAAAQAMGGHLITINDEEENAWVQDKFSSFTAIFIGLNAIGVPGTYKWADGSTSSYRNWAAGEPNTGSYNVTYMSGNGSWYDYTSTGSLSCLAEYTDPLGRATGGPGPLAQYILDVTLTDAVPPQVVSVTGLPENGGVALAGHELFSVTVSEPLDPTSVTTAPNFSSFNGHYYAVSPTPMNWDDATAYAESFGGQLVTVNDAEEQAWIHARFGTSSLWLGLNDIAEEGNPQWPDGSPVNYTHWAAGEPNTPSYDVAYIYSETGLWLDSPSGSNYLALVEIDPSLIIDSDGDGLADNVDPQPEDANNGWDLRSAGADDVFDSADDERYQVRVVPSYSAGQTLSLRIEDGPLQGGRFRLSISPSLQDVSGNQLDGNGDGVAGDAYQHFFTLEQPAGFLPEGRNNHSTAQAVELGLTEDPVGSGHFTSQQGFGSLAASGDVDWWSFEGVAGDHVAIWADPYPNPSPSINPTLNLYRPSGSYLTADNLGGPGTGAYISGATLTETGTWYFSVSRSGSVLGNYQVRLELARGLEMETDANYQNDTIASSDFLPYQLEGPLKTATVAGTIMTPEYYPDEDTFQLGLLNVGTQVTLSVRLPQSSSLLPKLSLWSETNVQIADEDGDLEDNHFSATIPLDAKYFARIEAVPYWVRAGRLYQPTAYLSWIDAEAAAISLGGHLVTVNDSAENDWLRETILPLGSGAWIGLNALDNNNVFVWADGTPVNYTHWAQGKPNTAGYNFCQMDKYGNWYDRSGGSSYNGIVELADPLGRNMVAAGPKAQYLLDVTLNDIVPPKIDLVEGLPLMGETGLAGIADLQVIMSEELALETVATSPSLGRYNGHHYILSQGTMNRAEALAYAESMGGQLLKIDDEAEQDWIYARFGVTNFWLGLNDIELEGSFVWADGSTPGYLHWSTSQPGSATHDGAFFSASDGTWYSTNLTSQLLALVELDPDQVDDSDQDGLPDSVDLYPEDPFNAWDLRAAGADELFDTADDITYELIVAPVYTAGLAINLLVEDGPLDAGSYRFTATAELKDLVGNRLDGEGDGLGNTNYEHFFQLVVPEDHLFEGRSNHSSGQARMLDLQENPSSSGYFQSNQGFGAIDPSTDVDWWSFEGLSGDRVAIWAEPYASSTLRPQLYLYSPSSTYLSADSNGGPLYTSYISGYVLPEDGTYHFRVSGNNGKHYRVRMELARGIDLETDANYSNNQINAADPLNIVIDGERRSATVAGTIMAGESGTVDVDYFRLGNVTAGETILLNVRRSPTSTLNPIIEVRNASNIAVSIAPNPFDAVARFDVSTTGIYYGTMVSNGGDGPRGQYIIDLAIQPTDQLDFSDLLVANIDVAQQLASGETVTLSWTVGNFGAVPATAPTWTDRIFLSSNTTAGDGDDLQLGLVSKAGPLAVNGTYTGELTFELPLGIAGDYTLFVQTDSGNNVPEFLFEGNNLSQVPITITRTPSADLMASNLNAPTTALSGQPVTISWTVSNEGNGTSGNGRPGGLVAQWLDRLVLSSNNLFGDGDDLTLSEEIRNGALDAAASYSASWTGPLTNISGTYYVMVGTDATNTVYEDQDLATNLVISTEQITIQPVRITTMSLPAEAGTATGAGSYQYGQTVTLAATPAPGYLFSAWTENNVTLTTDASFNITANEDRTFIALFEEANTQHVVSLSSSPAGLPNLLGAGTYRNGEIANIQAAPSIIQGAQEYLFQRFTLDGAYYTTTSSFQKAFTTVDQPELHFVAEYQERSALPLVTSVDGASLLPLTENARFTVHFNRAMDTAVAPLLTLSSSASSVPAISAGTWLDADSYQSGATTFVAANQGTYTLNISAAIDHLGRTMAPVDGFSFEMDGTPPPPTAPTVAQTGNSSIALDWSGYAAPGDLAGFRVYLSQQSFTNVAGLQPANGLGAAARSTQLQNLLPDTRYYVAVAAYDLAGNVITSLSALPVEIDSSLPPAVDFELVATAQNAAHLSWTSYEREDLLGFEGFRVYRSETNFSDVTGLTPLLTLAADVSELQVSLPDRSKTYAFAVVGFNRLGEFISEVTTQIWSDPLAQPIVRNLTLGGPNNAVINIIDPLRVEEGATLTLLPGTTLIFESGLGLTVALGSLDARGTAQDPIHLTSASELNQPQAGDWSGVLLQDGDRTSQLSHVWIRHGQGLQLEGSSPETNGLYLVGNTTAITLDSNATLVLEDALLAYNDTGIRSAGNANLHHSVIKHNRLFNAVNDGPGNLLASSNWWGDTDPAVVAMGIMGSVDWSSALTGEPVLAPALGTDLQRTGNQAITLHLQSPNAVAWRISEDSSFNAVPFEDIFEDLQGENLYNPHALDLPFTLSHGYGPKTVFAQLLSATGQLVATLPLTIEYHGDGPVIESLSLSEGQEINRPIEVLATASSSLGLTEFAFLVDDVLVFTSSTSPLRHQWDIRSLTGGTHRVSFLARDGDGNLASRALNLLVAPQPPPVPVILQPLDGSSTNLTAVTVSGTAEPGIGLRILRNGTVTATTTAAANGSYSVANVLLVEGSNRLQVRAFDVVAETPSAAVTINLDSGNPNPVVCYEPVYLPGQGLYLSWQFSEQAGERPSRFQVLWQNTPFSTTSAAHASEIGSAMNQLVADLTDGTWYLAVVGFDESNNPSALSNLVSYDLDVSPPTFSLTFDDAEPLGPGNRPFVLLANEALPADPILTVVPFGKTRPLAIPLAKVNAQTWRGTYLVSNLSATSGNARFIVAARDLAGNQRTDSPVPGEVAVDITAPAATIFTDPLGPVQVLSPVTLNINLVTSEVCATSPELQFSPPQGAAVTVALSGSGSQWSGSLTLEPAMGSGFGNFLFQAQDLAGNTGALIEAGDQLEIYNTPLPQAPAAPQGLQAQSIEAGQVILFWQPVARATNYAVYRVAEGGALPPTELAVSGISTNQFTDIPPTDGTWVYAVTASRLGAESGPSATVSALSDRTPPEPAQNLSLDLVGDGVRISWSASNGESPAGYVIARNGEDISAVAYAGPIFDAPPGGQVTYSVTALDALGNLSMAVEAQIQVPLGAVANLDVLVTAGQGPKLSWQKTDLNTNGYRVYRNGTLVAELPLGQPLFNDVVQTNEVNYAVRAIDASLNESPARLVTVPAISLELTLNAAVDGTEQPSLIGYFDVYHVTLKRGTGNGSLPPLRGLSFNRPDGGGDFSYPTESPLPANGSYAQDVVLPAPSLSVGSQTVNLTATFYDRESQYQLRYRFSVAKGGTQTYTRQVDVYVNQAPLVGTLNSNLELDIFNQCQIPIQVVLSTQAGQAAGDLDLSIYDDAGNLVGKDYAGASSPQLVQWPDGRGIIEIPPHSSVPVTLQGVHVPEVLSASTHARFKVILTKIYAQLDGNARMAGPLSGLMDSTLEETAYYGSCTALETTVTGDASVQLQGQALDRVSGQPVADVPLQIGFASKGFRWYQNVVTDSAGNYQLSYLPPGGFSGLLKIWAAHPDVIDILNQAQVSVYRLFVSPRSGEVAMTHNQTRDITFQLRYPGQEPLHQLEMTFNAYRMDGSNRIAINGLNGFLREALPATMSGGANLQVKAALSANTEVPEDAIGEFIFTSSEGASSTLTVMVNLLPSLPELALIEPAAGYVEVSLDRGAIQSRQILLENRGVAVWSNMRLNSPQTPWMTLNLPLDQDGFAQLPDLAPGDRHQVTLVFTPNTEVPQGFYEDTLTISGDNAPQSFTVNIFAQVSSSLVGSVAFQVNNILNQQVPGTSLSLYHRILGIRAEGSTDTNGQLLLANLQEGAWSWVATAPGHGSTSGVVEINANQVAPVEILLDKSLVTIDFQVTPVPYTDRYEITIEQVFETNVPAPVVVFDPPQFTLYDMVPGVPVTVTARITNHGLIKASDIDIVGSEMAWGKVTPLVDYLPELGPFESVEIPFLVEAYDFDPNNLNKAWQDYALCLNPFGRTTTLLELVTSRSFLRGLAALSNYGYQSFDGDKLSKTVAALFALGIIYTAITEIPGSTAEYFVGVLSCILVNLIGNFDPGISGISGGLDSGQETDSQSRENYKKSPPPDIHLVAAQCFAEGTLVTLDDGRQIPIEMLRVGDWLATGDNRRAQVAELVPREAYNMRQILLTSRSHPQRTRTLNVTGDHLIWADGLGWTSAASLQMDDWLLDKDGDPWVVTRNRPMEAASKVIGLRLSNDMCFYAQGFLAQDLCGGRKRLSVKDLNQLVGEE